MLNNLSDKQSLVRNDVIACVNKWADVLGPEVIMNKIVDLLTTENPESRTEAFGWILKNTESI
jgi:ubiquitin-protein ligase